MGVHGKGCKHSGISKGYFPLNTPAVDFDVLGPFCVEINQKTRKLKQSLEGFLQNMFLKFSAVDKVHQIPK